MITLSLPSRTHAYPSRHTSIAAPTDSVVEVAIIGAGIAGIASAYYICVEHKKTSVVLIDSRQPMSYTSAQSGDNYRNWWPHPTMTAFTNDSIDLLDRLAEESNNVFNMRRGGYALATRQNDIPDLFSSLRPDRDVVVLNDRQEIKKAFPSFSQDIANVIHIKRAGDISGQQLGQYMLEKIRDMGGALCHGEVRSIEHNGRYCLNIHSGDSETRLLTDVVVNAAGPFAKRIATMLDIDLPVRNTYQQKIAFDDKLGAIPRELPFSIDLDEKSLAWAQEERELLLSDPDLAWLAGNLPGGTHCRPEGGTRGSWVKLGWAYNDKVSEPQQDLANEPHKDPQFPEIVIRGAAALIPALQVYIESPPARFSHYGGYYTMTEENWPLIGPMGPEGSYVVGALSGFGSMSACAAGSLCATHICGGALPDYAGHLSLARYDDEALMDELRGIADKGLL